MKNELYDELPKRETTDEIIIHCTATPAGHDFTAQEIDQWHRARGWQCIGYHYVVYRDGSIHPGRPEMAVGAHCLDHNHRAIGIAYVGGLDEHGSIAMDTRTPLQKLALHQLVINLLKRYPKATVHGHKEFDRTKECPCFSVRKEFC